MFKIVILEYFANLWFWNYFIADLHCFIDASILKNSWELFQLKLLLIVRFFFYNLIETLNYCLYLNGVYDFILLFFRDMQEIFDWRVFQNYFPRVFALKILNKVNVYWVPVLFFSETIQKNFHFHILICPSQFIQILECLVVENFFTYNHKMLQQFKFFFKQRDKV